MESTGTKDRHLLTAPERIARLNGESRRASIRGRVGGSIDGLPLRLRLNVRSLSPDGATSRSSRRS